MSKSFFKNTNLWLLLSLASLLSACHLKENGQNTSPGQLKIITHNVWYGFTKVPDRKPDWIRWMEKQQADVVCLQELNRYSPGLDGGCKGVWAWPQCPIENRRISDRYHVTICN
jgi:hypothetical protein